MTDDKSDLLSIKQASVYLGVSESYVRDQVRRKRIPALRLGDGGKHAPIRISQRHLVAWVGRSTKRANQPHKEQS